MIDPLSYEDFLEFSNSEEANDAEFRQIKEHAASLSEDEAASFIAAQAIANVTDLEQIPFFLANAALMIRRWVCDHLQKLISVAGAEETMAFLDQAKDDIRRVADGEEDIEAINQSIHMNNQLLLAIEMKVIELESKEA